MLSADKVNEIFCIADDFCREFDSEIEKMSFPCDEKKHRRRKGQMSDSEIMTILICFHFNTYRNFKHYYLCYVKGYLKSYFPRKFPTIALLSWNLVSSTDGPVPCAVLLRRVYCGLLEGRAETCPPGGRQ